MSTVIAPPATGAAAPRTRHSGRAFFWGIVLLLAIGGLTWLWIGGLATGLVTLDAQRVKEREDILRQRNADDAHWLNDAPSYFNKDKGQVRVPIAQAMQMVLPALQSNKPHAAYPVSQDPPQPPVVPVPAGASPAPVPAGASPAPGAPTVIAPAKVAATPVSVASPAPPARTTGDFTPGAATMPAALPSATAAATP